MNSLNLTPTTFYLGADSFFYMIGFGSDFDSQTIFQGGIDKFVQKIELDKKEAFGFFSLSTKMNKKQSFKTENISF